MPIESLYTLNAIILKGYVLVVRTCGKNLKSVINIDIS